MVGPINKQVAECVGLWLAEGDRKTISEITFTNNSPNLIKYFYETITKIFNNNNFRLYVYLPSKDYKPDPSLKVERIKIYLDKRANKPYYIIRLANRDIVIKWKDVVNSVSQNKNYYNEILRGFFAGEGNIKTGSHNNRTLRIAQKNRILIIDNILKRLKINFKFSNRERAYVITGRSNWEKFASVKAADLHPIKKKRFWSVYNSFVEWHYPHHFIKNNILRNLKEPKKSSELAADFKRDKSRIQHILTKLKSEGKVKDFRVGSTNYWIDRSVDFVIISKRKSKVLDFLKNPKKTSDVSKYMNIQWKAAFRRLKELEKLNLVKTQNYLWYRIPTDKEVKVL